VPVLLVKPAISGSGFPGHRAPSVFPPTGGERLAGAPGETGRIVALGIPDRPTHMVLDWCLK
jgi:hypothetical protein